MKHGLVFIGIVLCCGEGCSPSPSSEKSAEVIERQQSEEGKMREWLSRGLTAPPPPGQRSREVPTPAAPNPHPSPP
jgi:hypothetical protein